MNFIEFTYTKADGTESKRAVLPLVGPTTFVEGIDEEAYTALLEDPMNPLFDRTISGQYPSGSTIKPVIASAALIYELIAI